MAHNSMGVLLAKILNYFPPCALPACPSPSRDLVPNGQARLTSSCSRRAFTWPRRASTSKESGAPGLSFSASLRLKTSLESSVIWGEDGRVSRHLSPGWGPEDLSRAAGRASDFAEITLQAKSSPLAKNGFYMLNHQKVV